MGIMELLIYIENIQYNWEFIALTGLMLLDVVTGYAKAGINHNLNSSVDTKGWIKRGVFIFMTFMFFPLTGMGDLGWIYATFAAGFIYATANSVIENLTFLGVPVPDAVTKYMDDNKIKTKN